MGVYIKGMEMPNCCMFCPISNSTGCGMTNPPTIMTTKEMLADRPDWCPLIPVQPHGRCIDADALVDKHFGKEFLSRVMTADEDDLGTALVNVPLVINNAPTIIEAEEGET